MGQKIKIAGWVALGIVAGALTTVSLQTGARSAMAALAHAPLWAPMQIPVLAWLMVICCAMETFKGGTLASYQTSHLIEEARTRFMCIQITPSLIS